MGDRFTPGRLVLMSKAIAPPEAGDHRVICDKPPTLRDIAKLQDAYALGNMDLRMAGMSDYFVKDKELPSWERRGHLIIRNQGPVAMRLLLESMKEGPNRCTNILAGKDGQANCKELIGVVEKLAEEEKGFWYYAKWIAVGILTLIGAVVAGWGFHVGWDLHALLKKAWAKWRGKDNGKGPPNNPTGGSPFVELITVPKKKPSQSVKPAVRLDPVAEGMRAFAKKYGAEGAKSFAPSPSKVSTNLPPMHRHVFVESDKGKVANRGGSLVFDHKKVDVLTPTAIFSGILAGIYYTLRQYARALVLVPK